MSEFIRNFLVGLPVVATIVLCLMYCPLVIVCLLLGGIMVVMVSIVGFLVTDMIDDWRQI